MAQSGRFILTGATVVTPVIQLLADVNASHVFNPGWPPHARFHAISALTALVGWSVGRLADRGRVAAMAAGNPAGNATSG